MRPLPVLLTRPRADAERLSVALRARGADRIVISPLLRIVPVGPRPELTSGTLLTSANAVWAFQMLGGVGHGPAWVVGPRTAAKAAETGFDVQGVAANVDELVRIIPADAPPMLHLRGGVTRGNLTGRLRERGHRAEEAVLYRQVAEPLNAEARSLLLAGLTLVPLFSPRTAELLGQECPPDARSNLRLLALSPAVAAACPVAPVGISETPDGEGMSDLVGQHLAAIGG